MAMSDWSTTASSNGTTLGINIGENCPAANINNALREIMAQTRTAITTAAATVAGNATVGGTLGVTGNATFSGTLGVTGALTLSAALSGTSGSFSGNGSFGGTFAVTGATTLSSTLAVTGAATLSGNTTVGGTFGVTGAATFSSTLSVTGNVSGANYLAGSMGTSTVTTVGFSNTNGPAVLFYGSSSSQAGRLEFRAANTVCGYFDAAGELFTVNGLRVGSSIAFSALSNFAISPNSGAPNIQWDTGDKIEYDRTGNSHGFYVGGTLRFKVEASGPQDASGNALWSAGNDGSGSGLDADKLDSYEGSAYVRVTSSSIIENGGYRVYADGLIETWGYVDVGQDSTGTYTLPVSHTSWVVPTISAYWPSDQTSSAHGVDWSGTTGSPPTSIQFRNSDDRTCRVWVHTKGA